LVTDKGLVLLSTMNQLQRLNLKRCNLSSAAVGELRRTLPQCDVVF
jgi:hypothetical protein